MIENEIDDVINYVLNTIYGQHLMSKVMSEDEVSKLHWGHLVLGQRRLNTQEWGSIVSQMQTMGLIYKQDGYWFLTGLGFDIIRVGGWKEHVRLTKENKKLHRDNLEAATKTNKSVFENQRRQNLLAIASIIVAIAAAGGTLGQWLLPLKTGQQPKPKQHKIRKFQKSPNHHKGCHSSLTSPNKDCYHKNTDSTHETNLKPTP